MKKLIYSFKYAGEGFISSFKTERNLKIHMTVMALVIILGFVFKISMLEWILCIICFGTVISAELFNTSIEEVVDLAMPHKNEKAKLAKDIAASGVLIMAISSFIVGLCIFLPKIIALFTK